MARNGKIGIPYIHFQVVGVHLPTGMGASRALSLAVWVGQLASVLTQSKAEYHLPSEAGYEIVLHDTKGDWLQTAAHRLAKTGVSLRDAQTILKKVRSEGKAVIARCVLATCYKLQRSLVEIGMKAVVQEQSEFDTFEIQQQRMMCGTQKCWAAWLGNRADQNGVVTLSFVNPAHVPFWYNLKCSFNRVKVNNDIVIGSDWKACAGAVLMLNTVCVVGNPLFFEDILPQEAHPPGSAQFAQIVRQKTKPVLSALELGYHVLFTDADVFWHADPRPWMLLKARINVEKSSRAPKRTRQGKLKRKGRNREQNKGEKPKTSNKETDFDQEEDDPQLHALFQSDYIPANEARCNTFRDCKRTFRCTKKPDDFGKCAHEASSGFYLLRAGGASIDFLNRVLELIALQHDDRAAEQWAFNAALSEIGGPRGNLKWALLPVRFFPNGEQFFKLGQRPESGKPPLIVQNNWLAGSSAKEKRFKEADMWIVGGSKERPNCKSNDPNQGKPPTRPEEQSQGGEKSQGGKQDPRAEDVLGQGIRVTKQDLKRGHKILHQSDLHAAAAPKEEL